MQPTTRHRLVPRLRTRAAIPPVQDTPSWHEQDDFRLASKPVVRTPSLLSCGYLGVCLRVKRSGCETDQPLPASEFNHSGSIYLTLLRKWIYTSTSPHAFMVLCLIRDTGQLYLAVLVLCTFY